MEHTIMIISTRNGWKYARAIGKAIVHRGHHYKLATVNNMLGVLRRCPEGNTIVHSRVAYPYIRGAVWLANLLTIKAPIFNSPRTLMLTSNKLACNKTLKERIPGLAIVESTALKDFIEDGMDTEDLFNSLLRNYGSFIVKPIVSSGGKNVFLFNEQHLGMFREFLENERHDSYFVQPYIPLKAMKRAIVIDGKALEIGYRDRREPDDPWKLSVCINPNIEPIVLLRSERLLAERVQQEVGGTINFIDLMEGENGITYISEINTSCNLTRHDRMVNGNIANSIAESLIRKADILL